MLIKSLALASLTAVPTRGAGCYPTWSSGSDYFTDSLVSATITTTSTSTASDGTVTETTTSETKNFKCTSGSQTSLSHCPVYDPSNAVQQAAAWSDQGVCSGTAAALTTPAPTTKPTPSRWTSTGCPEEWTSGGSYEGGGIVELDGNVYSCSTSSGANLWCGLDAYKPGDSIHWEMAWKLLGSCDGTIRPTTSPAYTNLADHKGCPVEYDASATYEAGDKVELNGLVYECRSWPNSGWCSQTGYEPDGVNYQDAWTILGYCDGTMAPTTSPNFSSLAEVGDGCPKEYVYYTLYEAGDQVSVGVNGVESVVYECKSWPNGAYCNSGPNFAPGTENGHLGWTKKGYCDGTLSPTKAPIAYAPVQKCRWYNGTQAITIEPWSDGKRSTYVAGTRVRKDTNVYKCKSWPYYLWCQTNNYEPEVGTSWMNAWSKAGECNGALEPTVSPSASPTGFPSLEPSSEPSLLPSSGPSSEPSSQPSFKPSSQPSESPSSQPSLQPSSKPSTQPSVRTSAYFENLSNPGWCTDANYAEYPTLYASAGFDEQSCQDACPVTDEFRGVSFSNSGVCYCFYDAGSLPSAPNGFQAGGVGNAGVGPVTTTNFNSSMTCWKYHPAP